MREIAFVLLLTGATITEYLVKELTTRLLGS